MSRLGHPEMEPREFAFYNPEERRDMDASVCRAAIAGVRFLGGTLDQLSDFHRWWACQMCPAGGLLSQDRDHLEEPELRPWLNDLEANLVDEIDGLPDGHPARPRHADVIAARNAVAVLKGAVEDRRGGYEDIDIAELLEAVSPGSAGRDRATAVAALEAVRDELREALPFPV